MKITATQHTRPALIKLGNTPASKSMIEENTTPITNQLGEETPRSWGSFIKDYGPYAIMGAFTTAMGVGLYEIFDGYTDWLGTSGFPIHKYPDTGEFFKQHHGGHGEASHETHEHSSSVEKPHTHIIDGKEVPCTEHHPPASRGVGSFFGGAPDFEADDPRLKHFSPPASTNPK